MPCDSMDNYALNTSLHNSGSQALRSSATCIWYRVSSEYYQQHLRHAVANISTQLWCYSSVKHRDIQVRYSYSSYYIIYLNILLFLGVLVDL